MRKKTLWAILVIPVLVSLLMPSVAMAPTESTVSVDPPVIWDTSMGVGTVFTVDIVVDYVENLWGYQFWLSFNPDVIHGVSVENGPFLGKDTRPPWIVIVAPGPGFDNDKGELGLFGASIFFAGYPPHDRYLADGGGVLATVTFEVVGEGCSPIALGGETGLMNKWGEWISYGVVTHGFFANVEGPDLRMTHGTSGTWEEYQTLLVGDPQTSYCLVKNYGEMGAWVEVEFVVRGPGGIVYYLSNQAWVPARDPVTGEPGEVTVSADYIPGPPGKYYVSAMLYFKACSMVEKVPYYYVEEILGGEGTTRDINPAYKVKTHM